VICTAHQAQSELVSHDIISMNKDTGWF